MTEHHGNEQQTAVHSTHLPRYGRTHIVSVWRVDI